MWRVVAGGLGLALLVGCQKPPAPVIGKRPAAVGEAPVPFRPAGVGGDWEDPRLRALRKGESSGRR